MHGCEDQRPYRAASDRTAERRCGRDPDHAEFEAFARLAQSRRHVARRATAFAISYRQQQRAESIDLGRKLLEKEAERFRVPPKKFLNNEAEMKRIANEYGLGRPEDLFASIGYGKTLPRNVIAKYLGAEKFAELDPEARKETRISRPA